MDGVSAAASVIAVVDLSAKVASLLFQYAKDVRHAKADVERLRSETANLKSAWENVKELLDGPNGARLVALQKFADPLNTALDESRSRLRRLQETLKPAKRHLAWLPGRSALKWPFEKKGVEADAQALARCTQLITLNLLVDHTYASRTRRDLN
jgi:hypothetical protein